jgi:hypothetical protein
LVALISQERAAGIGQVEENCGGQTDTRVGSKWSSGL